MQLIVGITKWIVNWLVRILLYGHVLKNYKRGNGFGPFYNSTLDAVDYLRAISTCMFDYYDNSYKNVII